MEKSEKYNSEYLQKFNDFRYIDVFTFTIKYEIPWEWMILLIHDEQDFPDAYSIHPRLSIERRKSQNTYWIRLKKKIVSGIDTSHSQCSKYSYNTCLEVYFQKVIEAKYKCDPTFLFNGPHLFTSKLQQCNRLASKIYCS